MRLLRGRSEKRRLRGAQLAISSMNLDGCVICLRAAVRVSTVEECRRKIGKLNSNTKNWRLV